MSSHEREEKQGEVETGEESSRHETQQEAVEAGREQAMRDPTVHDPTEQMIPLEDAIRERTSQDEARTELAQQLLASEAERRQLKLQVREARENLRRLAHRD